MANFAGGRVILEEVYGSSSTERKYIQRPDETGLKVISTKNNGVSNWFTKIFLPHGYPDSVSSDYVNYQIWDTAQAFCSTITGILATHEVLRGVGVGDSEMTPFAATITWVTKDGFGHLGKIFFAYTHGTQLDSYSKRWRFYADILNNVAMCIEISLSMFKSWTTVALCVSTCMKAIVGVAGGATRAALTQHHATRGNLGDVAAKDSAQETAVNLMASVTAIMILHLFGSSITVFVLMMCLHLTFNYLAVRAICLNVFNETRFLLLISNYLKHSIVCHPMDINKMEPLMSFNLGQDSFDFNTCGFKIKMGYSLKDMVEKYPDKARLEEICKAYHTNKYLIVPNIYQREMYVMLKECCENEDMLEAYFHAVLLAIFTCSINKIELPIYKSLNKGNFRDVCDHIQSSLWTRAPRAKPTADHLLYHEPSFDLFLYVGTIAKTEWFNINTELAAVGWETEKNLFMTDEWRVSEIPVDYNYDVSSDDDDEEREPRRYPLYQERAEVARRPPRPDEPTIREFSTDPEKCKPRIYQTTIIETPDYDYLYEGQDDTFLP